MSKFRQEEDQRERTIDALSEFLNKLNASRRALEFLHGTFRDSASSSFEAVYPQTLLALYKASKKDLSDKELSDIEKVCDWMRSSFPGPDDGYAFWTAVILVLDNAKEGYIITE